MRRYTQSLIIGSVVAALAGGLMMMGRNRRGYDMNKMMNSTINMMGKLGIFRLMGRSGLNRLVKFR